MRVRASICAYVHFMSRVLWLRGLTVGLWKGKTWRLPGTYSAQPPEAIPVWIVNDVSQSCAVSLSCTSSSSRWQVECMQLLRIRMLLLLYFGYQHGSSLIRALDFRAKALLSSFSLVDNFFQIISIVCNGHMCRRNTLSPLNIWTFVEAATAIIFSYTNDVSVLLLHS